MSLSSLKSSKDLEEEVRAVGYLTLENKSLKTLTERESCLIHQIIRLRSAQRYTVRKLLGEYWKHFLSKRSFGRRFKRAVCDGLIVGVELGKKLSNKSRSYELMPPRVASNDDLAQRLA